MRWIPLYLFVLHSIDAANQHRALGILIVSDRN